MTSESFVNVPVVIDLCESMRVDRLRWLFLLDQAENTVIEVLIEILSIPEHSGAGAALAGGVLTEASLGCGTG